MKKAYDIQTAQMLCSTRRLRRIWVTAPIFIFLVYICMSVLEVVFFEGDIRIIQLSLLCGIPLVFFAVLAFVCAPKPGNISFFVAIFCQIAFLAIGILTQSLNSYFFLTLIITGFFAFAKIFIQMAAFVVSGVFVNIMFMIFFLPRLAGIYNYAFIVQLLMTLFGSIVLLSLTYSVMQKDSRSDRALEVFSSLLGSTPNFMAITDSEHRVRYISKPMAKFAGFARREFAVGRPIIDLFSDKALKLMFADILDAQGFVETVMTINIDREERHFKVVADKLASGEEGLFIDISDITPLVNSRKDAEVASAYKSRFLANMSHEIRTPMNAILGITEIELEREQMPPETKEGLNKIYTSGYTLLGIINDILDLSKIETGNLELASLKYDIASVINDTVHLNIMQIGDKPVNFTLNVCENLPSMLIGDELRIKQILNNLLSNAFKYTEKGTVSLEIKAEAVHDFKSSNDIRLVIIVHDTGQGMTAQQIEKLFDEYERFNIEVNRSTEGIGLGMPITKTLVEMMNGEITVESEPNVGTTFTVYVMQKTADNGVIGKELAGNLKNFHYSSDLQMEKTQIVREQMPYGSILIVDDVETNLYVAKRLFMPYGLKIETAINGYETLEKIKAGAVYDIIFMDHMMPGMDGMETTKLLREHGYASPIVALTANAVVGQAEIFFENGFDDFISKPIDIRQLNAVLNKLIRDKQPQEIIEKTSDKKTEAAAIADVSGDAELMAVFAMDARKTLLILEAMLRDIEAASEQELRLYTTNVHAMKSALANIGEPDASELAYTLEKAGRAGDKNVIMEKTGQLINILTGIIEKVETEAVNIDSDTDEDIDYLFEQLRIIQKACEEYDDMTANLTLEKLKKMSWKKETNDVLNKITGHLFNGDFEKAYLEAEGYCIKPV